MKAIIKEIITSIIGIGFIAFAMYDFWVNKGAVSAMSFADIMTVVLITGVGIVLLLSPDRFVVEFVAGIRAGIRKLGAKDEPEPPKKP